jgi:transposase
LNLSSRSIRRYSRFSEGHVRVFDWLGGVPRECVYDNLFRRRSARSDHVVRL